MNTEWVLARLDEFMALAERHGDPTTREDRRDAVEDELKALLPVMERIGQAVEPGGPGTWLVSTAYGFSFWPGREKSIRLRTIVTRTAEIEAMLGPAGPQLAAAGLHAGVWAAAGTLWAGGHRREAVQAAATFVDLELQAKTQRANISGADLAIQAFKIDKLKAGDRVLRFPGLVEGTEAFISRQEGAKFFGAGVMLAIRNPATHDLTQPGEQVALEYLATLSILARWIDEADVVVHDEVQ